MITSKVNILPKSEIEIEITISNDDIKKEYDKVLDEVIKNADVKGFRKGKAPKKVVEQSVDKNKLYQQAFQQILPKAYYDSVQKNSLQPIMDPSITLLSPQNLSEIEDGKDVSFKAKTATKPPVDLKTYKEEIKKLKAKNVIWTPDKGNPKDLKKPEGPGLEEIISALLSSASIELPQILIEHEANRLLSQTLDEIKKLGLTLDQYLSSTKKTIENLRAEAANKATADLKLEFLLGEIAKQEKITVSNEEIDKVINENQDQKVKDNLEKQKYMLAAIILQQKTLDFLKTL